MGQIALQLLSSEFYNAMIHVTRDNLDLEATRYHLKFDSSLKAS